MTEQDRLTLQVEAQKFVDQTMAKGEADGTDPADTLEAFFVWVEEVSRCAQEAAQRYARAMQ